MIQRLIDAADPTGMANPVDSGRDGKISLAWVTSKTSWSVK